MKALSIHQGTVTVHLSPAHCMDLAAMCWVASVESFSSQVDMWRTLAQLFATRAQESSKHKLISTLGEMMYVNSLRSFDNNRVVAFTFNAAQCAAIAQAGQFVRRRNDYHNADLGHLGTLLFEACALLTEAQNQMCPDDEGVFVGYAADLGLLEMEAIGNS